MIWEYMQILCVVVMYIPMNKQHTLVFLQLILILQVECNYELQW